MNAPEHAEGDAPSAHWSTRPWLGIFGVLLGAMIASFAGRLLSVGLPELKSGLGITVDEAAWVGTVFNAALMFVGPFSVYLGAILGARRVLLFCSVAYFVTSFFLPLVGHGDLFFVLLTLAGLTAGTFYPLTLSFILRNLPPRFVLLGIAMYAMDIVFTTYIATSIEAWYVDHLSWRWLFWNSAILTPIMFVLILFGIPGQPIPKPTPDQPRPSWRGFLYLSTAFALIYAGLDQGQRLDWLGSGVIVALFASGGLLLLCVLVRRIVYPNPLINLQFLAQWNIIWLGVALFFFRLVMLSAVVMVPTFLSTAQGYKSLQTGQFLFWLAFPQMLFGLLAMWLMKRIDTRIVFASGYLIVGLGCVMNTHVTSVWAGNNFVPSLIVFACGFAFAFNGLVATVVLQGFNIGVMQRPVEALTYSGYFQSVRLLGGEIGTVLVLHMLPTREQFHSNVLVDHANAGNIIAMHRFDLLRRGMSLHIDPASAMQRAAALFALQIRQQAFTLAVADLFYVLAWATLIALCVVALLKGVRVQFRDIVAKRP